MLTGTIAPQSGSITILGDDIVANPEKAKRRIGYMSQKFSLFEDLTVDENLRFYAGVYDLAPEKFAEQRAYVLKMADLVGRENELTANLSVGWKQRLALGTATIHEPELLFLDEPTSGVDPVARRHFWDLLYDLAGRGVTLFVTTHYMDEAAHCDRLAFMYAGRLIATGSPRQIREHYLSEVGATDEHGDARTSSIEDVFVHLVTRERGGSRADEMTRTGPRIRRTPPRLPRCSSPTSSPAAEARSSARRSTCSPRRATTTAPCAISPRRVGVSEPALYRHFPGKEALFLALIRVGGGHMRDEAFELIDDLRAETVRDTAARHVRRPAPRTARATRRCSARSFRPPPATPSSSKQFRSAIVEPVLGRLAAKAIELDAAFGVP